ncbi:MAG: oligosaccharide flippase family protein [Muribaculaceae bacterium]|jgi:O-antigen/teichoic acid export membrane protein|nr:oligosaccharide flippase family protein [Muribaculaceae bacterium]CCX48919.1 putative uncharacterized protein [Bacteroides sp. CAG:927]
MINRQGSSQLSAIVLKALGVFGTSEGLAMLCGVVRTKLVALWIGASGVGLFGLFNSVVEMLGALTQTGIRNSAVRQIASGTDDVRKQMSIFVARRLCVMLGIGTGVLCAALSRVLSDISFGNSDYWWAFCWLGVSIIINSVTAIESGVLQGLHRLSAIARASVSGSILALGVSVPILYFLRIDGIVPVILAYSVCIFCSYWWHRSKEKVNIGNADKKELTAIRNNMLRFGIYLTASSFVVWCVNYLLMSYINHQGGETEMGYFQCGYTLIIKYMGVAFSAIGMEFFPRLSQALGRGFTRANVFVNHEIYVMLSIVSAAGCLLAAFAPWVVTLLYSADFMPAVPYVVVAMLGCVWRCVSWCMGYMIVAKGEGGIYMALEVCSGLICLALSIGGYWLMGMQGLGWAFALWYLVYAIAVYITVHKRYGYRMPKATAEWMIVCMAVTAGVVWLSMSVSMWCAAVVSVGMCALSVRMLRR